MNLRLSGRRLPASNRCPSDTSNIMSRIIETSKTWSNCLASRMNKLNSAFAEHTWFVTNLTSSFYPQGHGHSEPVTCNLGAPAASSSRGHSTCCPSLRDIFKFPTIQVIQCCFP